MNKPWFLLPRTGQVSNTLFIHFKYVLLGALILVTFAGGNAHATGKGKAECSIDVKSGESNFIIPCSHNIKLVNEWDGEYVGLGEADCGWFENNIPCGFFAYKKTSE